MFWMRRGTTMNVGACVGYRSLSGDYHLNNIRSSYDMLTEHIGQSFFHGKNYRLIIQCLINGEFSENSCFYLSSFNWHFSF
jgi:hypothetical protein